VEVRDNVEIYPEVPRPDTVEANDVPKYVDEIKIKTEDANSLGSMKLLI
jgi:hypothetical protein